MTITATRGLQLSDVEIEGRIDEGYGVVADAFRRNFTEHGEVGATFCLHVDGEPVVDVAAGQAADGRPYTGDTLQLLFSAIKGLVAVLVSHLAQRGVLDLDAPVAAYWPEFGAAGKEEMANLLGAVRAVRGI